MSVFCLRQTRSWGPICSHVLTLIPAWIINDIHYEVWDEITNSFPTLVVQLKFRIYIEIALKSIFRFQIDS